jgi:putative NADPH-quinone reductase
MPALSYRWYFEAHSLRGPERSILGFCGIGPIRESLIGMVEAKDGRGRARWLEEMRALGKDGC